MKRLEQDWIGAIQILIIINYCKPPPGIALGSHSQANYASPGATRLCERVCCSSGVPKAFLFSTFNVDKK